jgi:hypothetical protein
MNSDFREIPGYPGYVVDKIGCVYGPKQIMLNHKLTNRGYKFITPYINKKHRNLSIHRAVALAWLPNPNNYRTVDHINKNKQDNRIENLRWANDRTQNLNKIYCPNILGEKYIHKIKNGFAVKINKRNNTNHIGFYKTLAEAIEIRNQVVADLEEAGWFAEDS